MDWSRWPNGGSPNNSRPGWSPVPGRHRARGARLRPPGRQPPTRTHAGLLDSLARHRTSCARADHRCDRTGCRRGVGHLLGDQMEQVFADVPDRDGSDRPVGDLDAGEPLAGAVERPHRGGHDGCVAARTGASEDHDLVNGSPPGAPGPSGGGRPPHRDGGRRGPVASDAVDEDLDVRLAVPARPDGGSDCRATQRGRDASSRPRHGSPEPARHRRGDRAHDARQPPIRRGVCGGLCRHRRVPSDQRSARHPRSRPTPRIRRRDDPGCDAVRRFRRAGPR